mgnify:CR=1 FL=1
MGLGLAPALRAARSPSALALRGEARTFVSGGGLFSLRSGLILVQVALSLPLLIGSDIVSQQPPQSARRRPGLWQEQRAHCIDQSGPQWLLARERRTTSYNELLAGLRATPGVLVCQPGN